MELPTLLITLIFYAAFFGWYFRTLPIIRKNKAVKTCEYMFPRVMIINIIFSYGLAILVVRYSDSRLILLFPFLTTLLGLEYLWFKLTETRKLLLSTLTIKLVLIILASAIVFYFSSFSSTYIEQLTLVSTGVFTPFITLLTFMLSITAWILLAQLLLTVLSLIYTYRLLSEKGDYVDNLFGFFVCGMTVVYVLVFVQKSITNELIPNIIDKYFIETMYHKNEGLDKSIICSNLQQNSLVVLLPSGKVSMVTEEPEDKWVFELKDCIRN